MKSKASLRVILDVDTKKAVAQLAEFDARMTRTARSARAAAAGIDESKRSTDASVVASTRASVSQDRLAAAVGSVGDSHRLMAQRVTDSTRVIKKSDADVNRSTKGFESLTGKLVATNSAFTLLGKTMALIKWPAVFTGIQLAAQALNALAAGALALVNVLGQGLVGATFALVGALSSLAGAAASAGQAMIAFGQVKAVMALSGIKEITSAIGGMNEELDQSSEAFQNMTPQAQRLAIELDALQSGPLKRIQQRVQEPLFDAMLSGLHRVKDLLPVVGKLLEGTAQSIAHVIDEVSKWVGSKAFASDLQKIGEANNRVMRRMGGIAVSLGKAFMDITVAARPLTAWFGKLATRYSGLIEAWVDGARRSGALTKMFLHTRQVTKSLLGIVGNLGGAMKNMIQPFARMGRNWLDMLAEATGRLNDWTKSAKGSAAIQKFLVGSRRIAEDLGVLFRDIGVALWNIIKAGAPLGRQIVRTLAEGATQLRAWTESLSGKNAIADFFKSARAPLWEMGRLIRDMTKAFFEFADKSQSTLAPVLSQIRTELLPVFVSMSQSVGKAMGPALVTLATEVGKLFTTFAGQSGPLLKVVEAMGRLAKTLNWLIDNVPGLKTVAVFFVGLRASMMAMNFTYVISGMRGTAKAARGLAGAWRAAAAATAAGTQLTGLAGVLQRIQAAAVALANTTVVLRMRILALSAISSVIAAFNAVKAAWLGLSVAARVASAAIATTIVGALVAGAILIVTNWDKVKAGLAAAWEWIKQAAANVAAFVSKHWKAFAAGLILVTGPIGALVVLIAKNFTRVKEIVVTVATAIVSYLKNAWADVRDAVAPVISWIVNAVRNFVSFMIPIWKRLGKILWGTIKVAWAVVKKAFEVGWAVIKRVAGVVIKWFKVQWAIVKTLLIDPIRAAVKLIVKVLKAAWNGPLGDIVRWIIDKLGTAFRGLVDVFKTVFDKVSSVVSGAMNVIKDVIFWVIKNVINRIPGVEIKIDESGGPSSDASGPGGVGPHGAPGAGKKLAKRATGGFVDRPRVLVGEQAPAHPEYVIATNPAYRARNVQLWEQAGAHLGITQAAGIGDVVGGAISTGLDAIPGGGVAKDVIGLAGKAANIPTPGELISQVEDHIYGALPSWLRGFGEYAVGKFTDKIKSVPGSVFETAKGWTGLASGGVVGRLPSVSKAPKKAVRVKAGGEANAERSLASARGESAGVVVALTSAEKKRTRESTNRVRALKVEESATKVLTATAVRGHLAQAGSAKKLTVASEKLSKQTKGLRVAAGKTADSVGRGLTKAFASGKRHATDFGQRVGRVTSQLQTSTKRDMTKVRDSVVTSLTTATAKGTKQAKSLSSGVGSNFTGMSGTVATALTQIGENVNSILGSFGAKKLSFNIDSSTPEKGPKKLAQGGYLVPGVGSGDKVPLHINGRLAAMVEPKEGVFVTNRSATAALATVNEQVQRGPTHLQHGGLVPGFRSGGLVPGLKKGGTPKPAAGGMAAMLALANKYEAASYPYLWGGGHGGFPNGTQPVDCSGFVSDILHAGGLLDGAPMVSGALMNWGTKASGSEPLVVYANPGHTLLSLNGRFAGTSGSNPGGGAGWISTPSSGYLSSFAARTMDVGKGIAQQVKKLTLEGPDGPLKTIGQAAIDAVTKAANKKVAAEAPAGAAGGGDPGDPIPDLPPSLLKYNHQYEPHWAPDWTGEQMPVNKVAELAEWAGAPGVTMAQIAHGESNYRPGAAGRDANGYSVGYGLWAITTGVGNDAEIDSYGGPKAMWNPITNARIMSAYYKRSGLTPWTGTRFLTDPNAHYTGPMKKHGGVVLAAKGSAVPMPLPLAKPTTGGWEPIDIPEFGPASGDPNDPDGDPKKQLWPDLDKVIQAVFGAKDTKKQTADTLRQTLAANLAAKYEALKTKGLFLTTDGTPTGRLEKLAAKATLYGDFASKASSAADFNGGFYRRGAEPDLEGVDLAKTPWLDNGSQGYWLTKQLETWHKYREFLVAIEVMVKERQKRATKLTRRVNDKLRVWQKKLDQLKKKIEVEGVTPEDWKSGDLDPATADLEKWNALEADKRAALAKKFEKAGGVLPGTRAFSDNYKLSSTEGELKPLGAVTALLSKVVLPKLAGSSGLVETMANQLVALGSLFDDVQGSGGSHKRMRVLPSLDATDALGGYLYEAQDALRQIAGGGANPAASTLSSDLLAQVVAEQSRQLALYRAQVPVLQSIPYMGAFAQGGVALVGENGPELAAMPSGTRVSTASDTRAMMQPEVQVVLVDCTVDTHGKSLEETIRVTVNGELRKAALTAQGRKPSTV